MLSVQDERVRESDIEGKSERERKKKRKKYATKEGEVGKLC